MQEEEGRERQRLERSDGQVERRQEEDGRMEMWGGEEEERGERGNDAYLGYYEIAKNIYLFYTLFSSVKKECHHSPLILEGQHSLTLEIIS